MVLRLVVTVVLIVGFVRCVEMEQLLAQKFAMMAMRLLNIVEMVLQIQMPAMLIVRRS
jgi:hypothetical protein